MFDIAASRSEIYIKRIVYHLASHLHQKNEISWAEFVERMWQQVAEVNLLSRSEICWAAAVFVTVTVVALDIAWCTFVMSPSNSSTIPGRRHANNSWFRLCPHNYHMVTATPHGMASCNNHDHVRLKSWFFIPHSLAAASATAAAVVTVMVLDIALCTLVLSWCGRSHMVFST